jgi:hypothetical protein
MMRILAIVLTAALSIACNVQPVFAADFDGTWQAGGEPLPGSEQFCGDWFVRLVVFQGRPSGFVSVGAGFLPLKKIKLRADGSFTATAAGGGLTSNDSRELLTHAVSGRLSGDTITASLTIPEDPGCGTRTAQGTRLRG